MTSAKLQDKNPFETTINLGTTARKMHGPQLENSLEETPFIMLTKNSINGY